MGKIVTNKVRWVAAAFMALGLVGCEDEDGLSPLDAAVDSGGMDVGQRLDTAGPDAPTGDAALGDAPGADANTDGGSDAGGDAGLTPQALRGSYLVNTLLVCGDCHTPRGAGGAPDFTKFLAGNSCLFDVDPTDATKGCLASKNLTNDATGLATRTDAQIKDLITKGIRPDGKALHSVMPYYQFALLTDADANAVVAYLRTVPGVNNMVAASQAPFDMPPPAAATLIADTEVPAVPTTAAEKVSAERGRYLASVSCLECHTPELPMGSARPVDLTKAFIGNKEFRLGIPGLPAAIYSSNLTPHGTGLNSYSAADIVKAIKMGIDKSNKKLCPPMPSGMAGFANLTDQDALDIANYLLTLTPVANAVTGQCEVP